MQIKFCQSTGISGLLRVCGVLLLLLSLPAAINAAAKHDLKPASTRPAIGLVLAGGGAKGGAHVGVLKALERMRIPVDVIAGTSMGAVIGGLYASGKTPGEIEREILHMDWDALFTDSPDREDLSFRRKSDDRLYMFKAKPGFSDGELKVPLAYVHGQKFDLELSRILRNVSATKDFNQLPIPFRAVAADLETGGEVVIGTGSLVRAIRASMAVPGAFDPVEIDGKLLVDGGIVNNIPVSVARSMGADIVIVSDLGSDLLSREEITSGLDVGAQMVNFLFGLNSQKSLASLAGRDVLIKNRLGELGGGSFDRISETIIVGEKATEAAAGNLQPLVMDTTVFAAHLAQRGRRADADLHVAYIDVANDTGINDEIIRNAISLKPGDVFNEAQLNKDIQQLYGLDLFQSVRYEMTERDGVTGIDIIAEQKPWGPSYLQAGIIASTDMEGEAAFRLGLAYTHTQLNNLNGEMRIAGQVGDEPAIFAELYQPLDTKGRFFTDIQLGYRSSDLMLYDSAGLQTGEVYAGGLYVDLAAGRQFGNWGELRLGYLRQAGSTELVSGQAPLTDSFDIGQVYLQLSDDMLNSLNFPTSGHLGRVRLVSSQKDFGADADFEQFELGYNQVFSSNGHTIIGGFQYQSTIDDAAPYQSVFRAGGFGYLSGFAAEELSGQHFGLLRGVYMHRLLNNMFVDSYYGATLETGNVWQTRDTIDWQDNILAGSVFIGADTPVGPVYLSYGINDRDKSSIYLIIGPPFSF